MATDYPLTYEELLDNYEFKVGKRILTREYPWIKDVVVKTPEDVNRYNLIFVDVIINPFELAQEKGWRLASYVVKSIERGDNFWAPYLSTFFTNMGEEARELVQSMEKILEDLHKSPAIPQEMRLPGHRRLNIGSWYTQPGTQVPTDYIDWSKELE
jgi:hypothetical protein